MTHPKVIETLYYMLDCAILKGQLQDANDYLKLLRFEYQEDEKCFDILKNGRLENLKKLGHIVDQKLVVKSFEFQEVEIKTVEKDEHVVEKEKKLYKLIYNNQSILKECLNAPDDFRISSFYFSTIYGIIDLLGETEKSIYVIEIKKDAAKHDIIEQVHKYLFHFKLRMNYKLWDKVIGVVIANSFHDYTLKELLKANIQCIKYSFQDNNLRMSKI